MNFGSIWLACRERRFSAGPVLLSVRNRTALAGSKGAWGAFDYGRFRKRRFFAGPRLLSIRGRVGRAGFSSARRAFDFHPNPNRHLSAGLLFLPLRKRRSRTGPTAPALDLASIALDPRPRRRPTSVQLSVRGRIEGACPRGPAAVPSPAQPKVSVNP
jgi:hypothetical protein